MTLRSIEAEWNFFWGMVKPRGCSETQKEEMKKAFFAGAWALFNSMKEIGEPHITEEVAEKYLNAREEECIKFKDNLMKKHAERN